MDDVPPSGGFFLYGGWFEVAATRLIALHKNKGKVCCGLSEEPHGLCTKPG